MNLLAREPVALAQLDRFCTGLGEAGRRECFKMSAPVVLQCASCRSILSDTLMYLISSDAERRTVTVSEARYVSAAQERTMSTTGWDVDCAFRQLSCTHCHRPLGRMYVATTQQLSCLQNAYTFATDALVSYQLGSIAQVSNVTNRPDIPGVSGHDRTAGTGNYRNWQQDAARGTFERTADQPRGFGQATQDPTLRLAVGELDQHVCKLTTAMNQVTNAQKRSDVELKETVQSLKDLQSDYVATKGKAQSATENMQEVDTELVKMENMFLVWEERFQRIEAQLSSLESRQNDRAGAPKESSLRNMPIAVLAASAEDVESSSTDSDAAKQGSSERKRPSSQKLVRSLRSSSRQRSKIGGRP